MAPRLYSPLDESSVAGQRIFADQIGMCGLVGRHVEAGAATAVFDIVGSACVVVGA
jgi:hypothetical protein